jgi:hypothetical protein
MVLRERGRRRGRPWENWRLSVGVKKMERRTYSEAKAARQPRLTRATNGGAREERRRPDGAHVHKVTRLNDFIGLGALLWHFFVTLKHLVLRRREAASKDVSRGANALTNWIILRDAKLRFAPQDEVRGVRRHDEASPIHISHFVQIICALFDRPRGTKETCPRKVSPEAWTKPKGRQNQRFISPCETNDFA